MKQGSCSALSRELAEPQAGTASVATTWLCLEQPGPWGADALNDSHLDPGLAAELTARTEDTGVRIVLIRRPGSHADHHRPEPRQVYLASTRPGASWLEQAVLTDLKLLLDVDFAAAGAGRPSGVGTLSTDPLLLVCTNGRRDLCCALLGRPIARDLAVRHPGQVWETTHTGGHRFAPTAVLLPSGYLYGRLDLDTGMRILASAATGTMVPTGCRGRSTFSRDGQAAELAVRNQIGELDFDAITVTGDGSVRHRDGREWRVLVSERELPPARPASCGKAAAVPTGFVVDSVERIG